MFGWINWAIHYHTDLASICHDLQFAQNESGFLVEWKQLILAAMEFTLKTLVLGPIPNAK